MPKGGARDLTKQLPFTSAEHLAQPYMLTSRPRMQGRNRCKEVKECYACVHRSLTTRPPVTQHRYMYIGEMCTDADLQYALSGQRP